MSEEIPPPTDADINGSVSSGKPFSADGRVLNGSNGKANGNVVDINTKRKGFEWRGSREVFVPLPATPWVSRELQVGPGRPAILAGYGASAKTYSAQSLVLSVATGRPVWGRFECIRGIARHIDYEQGFAATARRYQWLAKGMGVDPEEAEGRLFVASLPDVKLNSPGALDAYCRACDGASLVVIDSLRGGLPGADENDSGVRSYVDLLTTASEKTGAAVLLVHHAGKPKDGVTDPRALLRGSSALFDAAGSVYVISNRKKDEPRLVQQAKLPADAGDAGLGEFGLALQSVADDDGAPSGLRVVHVALEQRNEPRPAEKFERDAEAVIELVRSHQGATQAWLCTHAGIRAAQVRQVLEVLVEEQRLVVLQGGQNGRTKTYRTGDGGGE